MTLPFLNIVNAAQRIAPYIHTTPIFESNQLNQWLGHRILFKAENLQKVGAFKARGGCNAVAHQIEMGNKPQHIVANSSGNHAQAVAWAAAQFNIPCTIFMPQNVSAVKAQATKAYGAQVELCATRLAVDSAVEKASLKPDTLWIPPYNHEDVIAGQGTAAMEVFKQVDHVDAIVAPCGGGGLLSGTLVAARSLSKNTKVIGVEPLGANDAAESLRQNKIVPLAKPADTLADGARTPSVGTITFEHLKELDVFYEAPEQAISYWTQWLTHLLKLTVEPTSAMSMFGVVQWLKQQTAKQTVVVILSGGNLDHQIREAIWQEDWLFKLPSLNK